MISPIFYWLLWGMWVTAAFLMKKSRLRSQLIFSLLILISLAGYFINIYTFKVNIVWMALIIWGYSFYIRLPFFNGLKLMFSNLTITVCYVLIRIYWLMDPAIFLVIDQWVFSLCLTGLLMAIVNSTKLRLSTAVLGICQGDLLYSLIFYPYENALGDSDCFSTLAVSLFVIISWTYLRNLTEKAQTSLIKQFNHRL